MSDRSPGIISAYRLFSAGSLIGLALLAASFRAAAAEDAPGQGFPLGGAPAASVGAPPRATASLNPAPASADFENRPFSFPASARAQNRPDPERPASYGLPSILPAIFYVTLVCGIFVGVLCLVKKHLPGYRQLFSHPAMEILGRTHLDPRRYVSLLRVGKRIIVIGVSPDEIHTLSEITDEGEILGILEVARPKSEMGKKVFGLFFNRQLRLAEAEENRLAAEIQAGEIGEQAVRLRERLAGAADGPAAGGGAVRAPEPLEQRKSGVRSHVDAIG
ncbi:MAG: flagellar biosynthetic protein FliO [Planctomycetota bacterium]|jgi:flagellar biogenesis protein FliO|nr:flagellar biosynthetic protein FliO [Planctomycetota bacterium]